MSHQPDDSPATSADVVATLRGAEVSRVRRRYARVAGIVTLLAVLVVSVLTLVSAMNDNARVERLKSHGVAVSITVTGCLGNLGGSGSNVVNYTCRGHYELDGVSYHEVIGSMDRAVAIGAVVSGVVDPSNHSYAVLASAARVARGSTRGYWVAGSLAGADVLGAWALWRVGRSRRD